MKVKGELSLYHKNAKVQYFYYIEENRQWTVFVVEKLSLLWKSGEGKCKADQAEVMFEQDFVRTGNLTDEEKGD